MFKTGMYQDCTTYQRTARPCCCAGTSYTGTVLLTRSRIDLHAGAGTPVCCANSAVVAPCSPARINASNTSATRSVMVAGGDDMRESYRTGEGAQKFKVALMFVLAGC